MESSDLSGLDSSLARSPSYRGVSQSLALCSNLQRLDYREHHLCSIGVQDPRSQVAGLAIFSLSYCPPHRRAAMEYFQSITVMLVGLFVYKLYNLWRYVRAAKTTGLRYVVVPLLETEIVAQLATLILRKVYTDRLDEGNGWPPWCRFMIKDWSWEDKRSAHDQYGDVFLVVSPAGIICYVADATVSWDVLNRRYDFTKPRDKYSKCAARCNFFFFLFSFFLFFFLSSFFGRGGQH